MTMRRMLCLIGLTFFTSLCFAIPTLNVMLDQSVNSEQAPLIIAQQLGLFKKHHIEVKLLTPELAHQTASEISDNKAMLGIIHDSEFIQFNHNNHSLVRVGTLIDYPYNAKGKEKFIHDELIFITKRKNSNDPRIQRFMEALRTAVHFIDLHPEQAWRHFIQSYPKADRKLFFNSLPYFAEEPAEFNLEKTRQLAEHMRNNHLIYANKENHHVG